MSAFCTTLTVFSLVISFINSNKNVNVCSSRYLCGVIMYICLRVYNYTNVVVDY